MIDGDIHVTVVGVRGDRVRLGITAPDPVTVDRQEVHKQRAEFVALRGRQEATSSVLS